MSSQQDRESCADPVTLSDFMSSLLRLFKIAIYYPAGHTILDKATEKFMRLLVELAGENTTVTLQDYKNTLMLEGIELNATMPFLGEFKTLLSTLGITALVIDREISASELHTFIRKLLFYKSKILSAKQFTTIDVSDLPHSINVQLKKFLARTDSSISDESAGEASENLETFLSSLSGYGLNSEEINQCKLLLEAIPERLSEETPEVNDLPYASWNDVARLLAQAVKGGRQSESVVKSSRSSHSNINALASILENLEVENQDIKSRDTINLLVSIIKKPLSEPPDDLDKDGKDEEHKIRTFPSEPELDISTIQKYTTENRLQLSTLSQISESSNSDEMLSILMWLAQYSQTLQNQIRMQQLFRELLSTEISDICWEIISNGLQAIIQNGNAARISSIIRLLVEPLRRSRRGNSLHLFLLTYRLCNENDKKILWPYIVNEMLLEGSSTNKSSYHQLCQYASLLPLEEMYTTIPHLQTLEAFENKSIASDIFSGIEPHCYSLFAFLLKTELEMYVGERILGGLRRNPSDWLIKALAPLLNLTKQEHKLFLFSYLLKASQSLLSTPLKNVAAKIVAETLPTLPQNRRNETWIPNTIAALAHLPTVETRALLETIANARKLLFFPEWPSECRKAADSAIDASKSIRY